MRWRQALWAAVWVLGCKTAAPVADTPAARPPPRPLSRLADVLRGDWPETCQSLKRGLGPEAHLVFTPAPPASGEPLPVWRLGFAGFEVAIPQDHYEVIPRVNDVDPRLVVVLSGAHGKVVLTQGPRPAPINDVFHTATTARAAEESRTVELFGKIPTEHDLIVEGFRHTPGDLTCDPALRERELPIALTLLAKPLPGARTLETVSAHGDVYRLGEWVISGSRPAGWDWEVHVNSPEATVSVDYQAPTQADLARVVRSIRLDKCLGDCATDGPPWLQKLAAAAAQPSSRAAWDEVEKALHPPVASH